MVLHQSSAPSFFAASITFGSAAEAIDANEANYASANNMAATIL